MKFFISALLLSLSFQLFAATQIVKQQLKKHVSSEAFVKQFPYRDYLEQVSFSDLATIHADRRYIRQQLGDDDDFIYHLTNTFSQHFPIKRNTIKVSIQIAERYLAQKPAKSKRETDYQVVGRYLLSNVANTLAKFAKQGLIKSDSKEFESYAQHLKKHKIYISSRESSSQKLLTHLKSGNFDYLLNRVITLLQGLWQRIKQVVFSEPTYDGQNIIELQSYSGHSGANIFRIVSKVNRQQIGHMVFLPRSRFRAKYYAKAPVFQRFKQAVTNRSNGSAVLAMSGGFTNHQQQPEGLTVESGKVVNLGIMHDRDGLIILQRDGGIRVINLKRETIKLPKNGGGLITIQNPLSNILGYAQLLKWAKKNRSTVFQTQLLAFGNQMAIDQSKARYQLRERRFLGLISKENGEVEHLVINLPLNTGLYEAAQMIFDFTQARKFKLEALINLDVGSYNIMQVYTPNGRIFTRPAGKVSISQATNLITYWQ